MLRPLDIVTFSNTEKRVFFLDNQQAPGQAEELDLLQVGRAVTGELDVRDPAGHTRDRASPMIW